MMYTEFVSSDALVREAKKSMAKLCISPEERPMGIQLYGHIPETLLQAAKVAEQVNPDLIDLNFGCPVRKIAQRGAGSGWLLKPEAMVALTRDLVKTVHVPVTVKTRLGWDSDTIIIEDLALRLQDVGIAALTIHARTRAQLYKGEADWSHIGKVKNNPNIRIPIIGNGDIRTPQQAKYAFDTYGVDAVMIGRASFGHPWIFKEIRHYLDTGELLPALTVRERVALAKKHLQKSIAVKGERVGVLEMRRHLSCYFKGLDNFKETRLQLVTTNEPEKLYAILNTVAEKWGDSDITSEI